MGAADATGEDATRDATIALDVDEPGDVDGDDAGAETDDASVADISTDAPSPDLRADASEDFPEGSMTVVNGHLKLTTSTPHRLENCEPGDAVPCDDVDGDGLVDAWEALVLDRFRPALVFDEDEQLVTDPGAVVAHVGRVAPARHPQRVTVFLTILYSRDYGTCGSLTSHDGDSERVAFHLWIEEDGPFMLRAYTAAHENTPTDHSMRFEPDELGRLEYDEQMPNNARWVVYPSKDKHATYITRDVCEGISPLPCFSEACGPDGEDRAEFTMLAEVYNAGEPDAPMLEDLTGIGFPGEQAWEDQKFCGGRSRDGTCSGSVLAKLTNSPFQ